MKNKDIKNLPESIRTRLNNISKESGRRFDAVLLQYIQERFLYRISFSKYRDNLILKGALLLLANNISRFRPTKDIDFLGLSIGNDPDNINRIISDIASIKENDGLIFDSKNVVSEVIKKGADYEGVRIKLDVRLGAIRRRIQLDIGFGDTVSVGLTKIKFPVLLDLPPPKIMCYTFETVIAEKIESIVKLNFFTSRIKDFYDILFLAGLKEYNVKELHNAVSATFNNRETDMNDIDIIFSNEFINDSDKQDLWTAFIKKMKLIYQISFQRY